MSLIEVMVAVFVLAAGLLGLGALQARSLVYSQSAYYRSLAADLAGDLADRIRANRLPILKFGAWPPNFSLCIQSGSSVVNCPTDFRVSQDMTDWNSNLQAVLPNATFTLVAITDNVKSSYRYTLTITWFDDRSTNANASYVTVIE